MGIRRYDKPIGVALLAGLFVAWAIIYTEQEATYPALHAIGIRSWAVTCAGQDRIYRLQSKNTSGHRSGASVIQRSLSLYTADGEELYYTMRFDPDVYEMHKVWSFRVSWDNRLFAPRWRSGEVLYGDEEYFKVDAGFGELTVVMDDGGRLGLACQPVPVRT